MKIKIDKNDIADFDKAIKIRIAELGDFQASDMLLSRVMWNMLFNPSEYKRCRSMLTDMINKTDIVDIPKSEIKIK